MNEVKPDGVEFAKLRYVEVKWLDAAVGDSWVPIHGTADIEVAKCVSRGWIMKEDVSQIVLCGTVGFDSDGYVTEANTTIAIPRNMIETVTDFPIRPRRRRVAKVKQEGQPTPPAILVKQFEDAMND